MRKQEIGAALDRLPEDVRKQALNLTQQYRDFSEAANRIEIIKQSVDTPRRARAMVQYWIDRYNERNGPGTGQVFLAECLVAAGSTKTLSDIDSEIASIEAQAQTIVDNVAGGWTWDQVADAIEANIVLEPEEKFSYRRLPLPEGYVDIWGDTW